MRVGAHGGKSNRAGEVGLCNCGRPPAACRREPGGCESAARPIHATLSTCQLELAKCPKLES
eukprot:9523415-Lingulodinium_polyedra.AAC.1